MENIKEELENLLKQDDRLTADDGTVMKNKVVELAHKLDEELLKLLMSSDRIKQHFFEDIGGTLVFDKVKFQDFVNLKEFLPDSYTEYKTKIGLQVKGDYLAKSKDVELVWPYKDCILEGGQTKNERENRKEIFWNETLAPDQISRLLSPKVLTNFKQFDKTGENRINASNLDLSKENLIIKGNNLLALHSLKKQFSSKIKLIYIDPPYNRGDDEFAYNDNFNHSTWLTFMKNRLNSAKSLLRNDGIICVQCDDYENAYLKVLMDDIFPKGFLNNIAIKMSEASGIKMNHSKNRFPKLKEYILIYKMPNFEGFYDIDKYQQNDWDNENNIFLEGLDKYQRQQLMDLEAKESNTDEDVMLANNILANVTKKSLNDKVRELNIDSDEEVTNWMFENSYRIIKTAGSSSLANRVKNLDQIPDQEIASSISSNGLLFFYITDFNRNTKQPRLQVIFADSNIYKNPCDFWQDIKTTGAIADEGSVKLSKGKKPEKILHRLIKMITKENDIVLDYHLGSGTTAAVAHKMKRQYIGIEQLSYGENDSVNRLQNVIQGDKSGISRFEEVNWQGGGSFIYCELAKDNARFIQQIEDANDTQTLKTIWQTMQKEGFLSYRLDETKVFDEDDEETLSTLSLDEQKQILIRTLDLNQLYVNYSEIEDERYNISEEEKALNHKFYSKDQ